MSIKQDILNHTAYIKKLRTSGGQAVVANESEPNIDAGLFDYPAFEFGKVYKQYEPFIYDGKPGFVRQLHTSAEHYVPFSVGTESLYGARPRQRPDGTYPYVYNMKAEVGMRVVSEKDGKIYKCIQTADPLLYDPADVPALFTVE